MFLDDIFVREKQMGLVWQFDVSDAVADDQL